MSVKAAQEAIRALPDEIDTELIIVDDASSDNSIGKLDVKSLPMPGNGPQGPAKARNYGVSNSKGEVVAFIDADVMVKEDTFIRFMDTFNSRPDIDAVFGSYDDKPYAKNFISQYKNLFHHFVHQNSLAESSSFWAGCGAIRRETFDKVGGFPQTRTRPAIEDIELGYKLSAISAKTILNKDITVKHLKEWDLYSLIKTDILSRGIPWTLLLMQTRELPENQGIKNANQISMVLMLMLILTGLVSFSKPVALILIVPFSAIFLYLNWGLNRFFGAKADLNLQSENRISVALVYLMLISLVYVPQHPWILASTLTMLLFYIYLNLGLYEFFLEKRGVGFLVMAFAMHFIYYIYNGISFLAGSLIHLATNPTTPVKRNNEQV